MARVKRSNKTALRKFRDSLGFCCLRSDSDDDHVSENPYGRGEGNSQLALSFRGQQHGGDVAGPSGVSQIQPVSAARDFRSRLALSAVTATQEPGPSGILAHRRFAEGADDGRYVVHTSVEYSNCLVPGLDKIIAAPYYWGVMDRYEAEDLLDNKPEGTFLLRDSAQTEYLFSVSFRRYKRTLHARIEQKNHYFSFDFSDTTLYSAKTITNLIAYYNDPAKCLFFEPQLTVPLPRNFVFSLQSLCRARIASMTTYDGVDKLNLPGSLKNYVKEYYYPHPVKTTNHTPHVELSQNGKTSFVQYHQAV